MAAVSGHLMATCSQSPYVQDILYTTVPRKGRDHVLPPLWQFFGDHSFTTRWKTSVWYAEAHKNTSNRRNGTTTTAAAVQQVARRATITAV